MYEFSESKKRINEILNSKTEIKQEDHVPTADSEYTYDNGMFAWVSSIFVDIVNSSALFASPNKEKVARIIRAFSQEIIDIMSDCSHYRQIGLRGDCVFGIFDGGSQKILKQVYYVAERINSFIDLFNKQLKNRGFDQISVGIGVAVDKDLIIKVGKTRSGINDRVWIGTAVVEASALSTEASREISNYKGPILMNGLMYSSIIVGLKKDKEKYEDWIKKVRYEGKTVYSSNVIFTECRQ